MTKTWHRDEESGRWYPRWTPPHTYEEETEMEEWWYSAEPKYVMVPPGGELLAAEADTTNVTPFPVRKPPETY